MISGRAAMNIQIRYGAPLHTIVALHMVTIAATWNVLVVVVGQWTVGQGSQQLDTCLWLRPSPLSLSATMAPPGRWAGCDHGQQEVARQLHGPETCSRGAHAIWMGELLGILHDCCCHCCCWHCCSYDAHVVPVLSTVHLSILIP